MPITRLSNPAVSNMKPVFCNIVFKETVFILTLFHLQYHFLMIHGTGTETSPPVHHIHGHHYPFRHSLEADKAALLAFKRAITDPNSTLENWNETTHVCHFNGVRCDGRHLHRVVVLNLNDSGLVGVLPSFISNLTQLRRLELVNNHFYGLIPSELSSLRNLRGLKLDENRFSGPIPDSFASLAKLILASMSGNNLTGKIPPSFFSNCTSLHNVDLSMNQLNGSIPTEIGSCPSLWNLNLYGNQLTGEIPFSLTNATQLVNLDVEYNQLSGELPVAIVSRLPIIFYLHLSYNNMISSDGNTNLEPFFTALSNCTQLLELELAGLGLGGSLPRSIGGDFTTLQYMLLQENHIQGPIPQEIGHLSHLVELNLTLNQMNGTIIAEMGQLSSLEKLIASYNNFSGEIPAELGKLSNLLHLDLSNNRISGEMPDTLGNLKGLNLLYLNNNLLSGQITASVGKCKNLYFLDLSYNRLRGVIPREILAISDMRGFLNLSHNQLEGKFPSELSTLNKVQEIDLSFNNLNGTIPSQISSCVALQVIKFSNNYLQGVLPQSIGNLQILEVLDVSHNMLSGPIPTSLNKIRSLTSIDFSFNNFNGVIPTGGIFDVSTSSSFQGNPNLCGNISGFQTCHRKKRMKHFHSPLFLILLCTVIFVSAFCLTLCCVIGHGRLRSMIPRAIHSETKNLPPELNRNFPRITYKELAEATGGFGEQSLVGSGGYGRVYKGVLRDGTTIAVKVLSLQTGNSTKSFNRECQVLKRIRHRNLIRIITACSLPDFKALVLPYMVNGSLDSCLYPETGTSLNSGSSDLSLLQRVNICSDIAEGMAYLHHHSPIKVIHCDLKPNNVLLNDDMTALVSDFGLARLVMTVGAANTGAMENMGSLNSANMLCGSIGYIAPEYGFGASLSTKGDVYSFGVLVLEMVTGKRPTNNMFTGELNLPKYVKGNYLRQAERLIDVSLMRALKVEAPEVKRMWEVAIGELLELGILCTQDSPSARPTMLDAADDLDRLKKYLSGDTTATFASSLGISSSTVSSNP